jgi:TonB family protein
MIAYVLKSSLCLIILFGLYWFLLRKEKLFVFNRFFLILSIVFSLAVPLISIPVNIQSTNNLEAFIPSFNYTSLTANAASDFNTDSSTRVQIFQENQPSAINLTVILFAIYFSGALFFLIRFLRNIFIILRRTKSSEKVSFKEYQIVLTDDIINPCCFLSNIYLNKHDYLSGKIDKGLIDHEIEHARQSHTFDIIFVEFVKIFYWFNPVYILYDRAIRINHEYLADNRVISDKSDIKDYVEKLLSFITYKANMPLTCGSNHSFTKKRLTMMMASRSGIFIYGTKIALTVFTGSLVFLLFSFKAIHSQSSDHNLSGTITEIAQNSVRGIVTTNDGVPLSGVTIKTTLTNNQSIETISDFDGRFSLDDVQSGASLLIEYRGFKAQTIKADFLSEMVIRLDRDPNYKGDIFTTVVQTVNFRHTDFSPANSLVVINGRTIDIKDNLTVNPNEISTFKVLKDRDAVKKYGEKGRDGVIEITTYGNKTRSRGALDSSLYKTLLSINKVSNKGELIDIPVSNLQYIRVWTDHYLNKTNKKEFRSISIATRDYFKVKGTVINENKKPLAGVKITATDNPAVEMTDKNGNFLINDVREGAILNFSMPEYKTYHLSTLFEVAFNIDQIIQLEKDGKEDNEIYEKAEKMPQYPGGDMELLKFVAMNTQYPEAAKTEKAQGKVIVKFVVDTEGKVKDAMIIQGVHPALDAEALRVVGKLERFIPGTDGGNPVNVYYYLPITFSLPVSNTQK